MPESEALTVQEIKGNLEWAGNTLAKTTNNFLEIMLHDRRYSDIRFNVVANNAEVQEPDPDGAPTLRRWCDADEAGSRAYIEKVYGLYARDKHQDALRLLFRKREYNPIKNLVESIRWDGEERCEAFLRRWADAEDTPYTREVSRLIFAGGINRLYMPGCKFDDVPILIGTHQGEGKSSLIRWLAMHDSFYGEVNRFDGQEAIEQLSGKWICEISELLALTRTKEVEASKAYITRTVDQYRMPYDRNVTELPRRCIFIGTTNNATPLKDMTGNRRFYPVKVNRVGYDLFDHEAECREYIMQCWAEALVKYRRGEMKNYARRDLVEDYRAAQEDAMMDDWRVGAIETYLADKAIGDFVCVRELCQKALSKDGLGHDPSIVESKDIGLIMQKMSDWEKTGLHNYSEFGRQRSWVKTKESLQEIDTQEELPF